MRVCTAISSLVIFLSLFYFANTATVTRSRALAYLQQYGYLDARMAHSHRSIEEAIMVFQKFFGVKVTGVLDKATINKMSEPRCGVKDNPMNEKLAGYRFLGSKWETNRLTYQILNHPPGLSAQTVSKEVARAFAVWSEVADLTFRPVSGNAHIELSFEQRVHGDGDDFDGPGNVLAHATSPPSGVIHFDLAEQWTAYSDAGINFFQVAAHEIGHALGLDHEEAVRGALMFPSYQSYQPNFSLHRDDIRGIQALYGPSSSGQQNSLVPVDQKNGQVLVDQQDGQVLVDQQDGQVLVDQQDGQVSVNQNGQISHILTRIIMNQNNGIQISQISFRMSGRSNSSSVLIFGRSSRQRSLIVIIVVRCQLLFANWSL